MQILNDASIEFLEQYLNNASPTGYESGGQKIGWTIYDPSLIRLSQTPMALQ